MEEGSVDHVDNPDVKGPKESGQITDAPRFIGLLSGGIDSPVAIYLMLKKGADGILVHFDNRPFTDDRQFNKVQKLAERLSELAGKKIPLYVVPHGLTAQAAFSRSCDRHLQCVLCRRMMLRAASELARQEDIPFLVTGESLGQVASQTIDNILTEDRAAEVPVLRPLIGMDKTEIIDIAREIGTFEPSTEPGLCCTIVPEKPAITSTVERAEGEEENIDISELVKQSLKDVKIL